MSGKLSRKLINLVRSNSQDSSIVGFLNSEMEYLFLYGFGVDDTWESDLGRRGELGAEAFYDKFSIEKREILKARHKSIEAKNI